MSYAMHEYREGDEENMSFVFYMYKDTALGPEISDLNNHFVYMLPIISPHFPSNFLLFTFSIAQYRALNVIFEVSDIMSAA